MKRLSKFWRDIYGVWRWADSRTFFRYLWSLLRSAREVAATGSLVSANEKMRGGECCFSVGAEKAVRLDGEFFGIAKELCCRRVYFTLPGFELDESDIVVDLGAQVGVFTTLASVCAKKVVSVEAQAGFIPVIEGNVNKNRCGEKVNVEWGLIGAGAGLFSDTIKLKTASHYSGEPPTLTMAELLGKHGLDRVDFMKVDIEGSEFALFVSGADWLDRVRRIAMEVHFDFGDPAQLAAMLERAGFEVWLVNNDQQVVKAFDRSDSSESGYIFARRNVAADGR